MGDGTQLDIVTILVGLAVVVVSTSLAQLVLLVVASYLKRKSRQENLDDIGKDL